MSLVFLIFSVFPVFPGLRVVPDVRRGSPEGLESHGATLPSHVRRPRRTPLAQLAPRERNHKACYLHHNFWAKL